MKSVEILAPAGNFEALHAALDAGADAVYFGVGTFNMRAGGAANFPEESLPEVVSLCHARGAKAYLTLNTIIYDGELPAVRRVCENAKAACADAVIAGDPAVLRILRELGIPVHLTVQCNVSNLETVRFYAPYADVMVLARELPLGSVRAIVDGIRREKITGPSGREVGIEIFAHGALCIGISGRCGMSLCTYGRSSNRGQCLQNCRRRYAVRDIETGDELELSGPYVLSPRDICTLPFLDRIAASGVSLLKIEGRGRPADYVYTTVSVYREALAACADGTFTQEKVEGWKKRLSGVFNRGFWDGGYYLGNPLSMWSSTGGNLATFGKTQIGHVVDYYARPGVAAVKVESGTLRVSDRILILGNATGMLDMVLDEIRVDDVGCDVANQGDIVCFPVAKKVRIGDRVQVVRERVAGMES